MKSILLFATALSLPALAAWNTATNVDPMTDEARFVFSTPGEPLEVFSLKYTPFLCVRVPSNQTDRCEIFFEIQHEGLKRGTSDVLVRFDKTPAESWNVTASTDRRAGFFANPSDLLPKLKQHNRLTIRFQTTLQAVRTTSFTLTGLAESLAAKIAAPPSAPPEPNPFEAQLR